MSDANDSLNTDKSHKSFVTANMQAMKNKSLSSSTGTLESKVASIRSKLGSDVIKLLRHSLHEISLRSGPVDSSLLYSVGHENMRSD